MTTQAQTLDDLFTAWCAEMGMTMDSAEDHEDFKARGHLSDDPGSDVHDGLAAP